MAREYKPKEVGRGYFKKFQKRKIKKGNVSLLRQWLNEDRITNPSKMVTDEQILRWLENDFGQESTSKYIKRNFGRAIKKLK